MVRVVGDHSGWSCALLSLRGDGDARSFQFRPQNGSEAVHDHLREDMVHQRSDLNRWDRVSGYVITDLCLLHPRPVES